MKKVFLMLVAVVSLTMVSCDKDNDASPIQPSVCSVDGVYNGSDEVHGAYSFELKQNSISTKDGVVTRNVTISLNGSSADVILTTNTIGGLWKIDSSRPVLDGKKINFVIIQELCVISETLIVGFEDDTKGYVASR